jgi:hypothetical protein
MGRAAQQLARRRQVPRSCSQREFVAGVADWGVYQKPGELQRLRQQACSCFAGLQLLPGAGHWVQQERVQAVTQLRLDFLATARPRCRRGCAPCSSRRRARCWPVPGTAARRPGADSPDGGGSYN